MTTDRFFADHSKAAAGASACFKWSGHADLNCGPPAPKAESQNLANWPIFNYLLFNGLRQILLKPVEICGSLRILPATKSTTSPTSRGESEVFDHALSVGGVSMHPHCNAQMLVTRMTFELVRTMADQNRSEIEEFMACPRSAPCGSTSCGYVRRDLQLVWLPRSDARKPWLKICLVRGQSVESRHQNPQQR
jgi:hypothetical protein